MDALAWHVTHRLRDGRVLARDGVDVRVAARVILTIGARFRLVAFHLADTHLHSLVACSRTEAGCFARTVECTLRKRLRLPTPFEPARFTSVETQRHLERAFLYVLRQQSRHGLPEDAWFEGSNLLDLRGLRVIGAFTRKVAHALMPRLMAASALQPVAPRSPPPSLSPNVAVERTLVAACLPSLSGKALAHREARVALAAAVPVAGGSALARAIGVGRSCVRRDRASEPSAELVAAIRRCLCTRTEEDAPPPSVTPAPDARAERFDPRPLEQSIPSSWLDDAARSDSPQRDV